MAIAQCYLTWYALAMFFSDKSDLISVDFKPRGHALTSIRVEWKNWVLNGAVAGPYQPLADLSDQNLTELLVDVFGPLKFIEMAELYLSLKKCPQLFAAVNWMTYFKAQNMNFTNRTEELLKSLSGLPDSFFQWCYRRDLSPQDLMPILALKEYKDFATLSTEFENLNLSRSEGKLIIDLLVDLLLMGRPWQDLGPETEHGTWLNHLQRLRYPMRESFESQSQQLSSQLPKYLEIRSLQQGDRTLKRLQITYSDNQDLHKKIERLKSIEPLQ